MKRLAVSFLASVGLLALSAVPASAAPRVRFDIPEECGYLPGYWTNCATQSGQYTMTETPSGNIITQVVTTLTIKAYEGDNGNNGALLGTNTYNYKFTIVTKGDTTAVQHQRLVFENDYPPGPCLIFTENFTVVNGEYRHYSSDTTECK
jgi:hypothetical protein